jgi:hypothetical protein
MTTLSEVSSKFERTIDIKLKKSLKRKLNKVIYGNNQVGFFESKSWKKTKAGIELTFLPPTYKKEISVFGVLKSGKEIEVFRDSFDSPLPKIFSKSKVDLIHGKLSNSFYLLNGALPRRALFNPNFEAKDPAFYKKNANRFTYLMIVNKLGEIVWAHVPIIDGSLFGSYMSAKRIGDGYYGIMFGKHSGYFEVVKYDGKILRDFSSRDSATPFAMHHDFEMIGSNKLYAVGNRVEDLFAYTKMPEDKGKTFLTDTIIGINLKKGTAKELRNFSKEFNPDITPFFTGDKKGDKKFAVWGKPKVDLDFLHINSVEHIKNKGVLVSFRNISKVALLDSNFDEIKWTVGAEESDTFYIKNKSDRFLQQHTPVLLSDDTLILFDNAAKSKDSRVVKYHLNKSTGTASKIWEYNPKEKFYSKDRSSVYKLANGNYGVYFVNPRLNGSKSSVVPHRDYYMEVDSKTAVETARVKFTWGAASPGYRMIPVKTIGKDPKYLRSGLSLSSKRKRTR